VDQNMTGTSDPSAIAPIGKILDMTTSVVAAWAANNAVTATGLQEALKETFATINAFIAPPAAAAEIAPTPAVPVKKSITPDYLISLEDGRQYKSLKRHLTGRGLTPEEYRQKWSLPSDYPMVAPNYAKQRSELAKQMGLGQNRQPAPAPVAAPAPAAKRTRVRKAA
jgi:predicted transcriptional regulator